MSFPQLNSYPCNFTTPQSSSDECDSVEKVIFTIVNFTHMNNKQTYKHAFKLPDGRSGRIRLFTFSEVSGSVSRPGNKQSVLLGW
ncbi:TPA: hypothetical protein MJD06_25595 [Klebsiella pneumoniae]|uniref:Uncharacterized protein n=1 Tax=Klebsiella pneumoniae TaxID=573 RepID=A0A483F7G6_KLEPN|nr:hypothetical protein [Salmonella enterica subsp. enterica serovar Thompson]MBK2485469.1 hypothetical protein [Klebsiella pneumoniae]MBX4657937.1 hypothetical protein [Klebsiella pneumoniae]MBX4694797.1 hypothetical protein [Klebsiella pneumoniae]PLD08111.1 hypothetical protein B6I46_18240 [Klebsiella pneumoniae]